MISLNTPRATRHTIEAGGTFESNGISIDCTARITFCHHPAEPCAGLLFLETNMTEMPAPTPVYLRHRKEPMTLDERKTGIYNEWRRDPDMVRSVAECIGNEAGFIKAMDDYLVLTVTTGLTAAATRDAAAKLQSMMAAKLREWADSEAEDVHRKQITEAA